MNTCQHCKFFNFKTSGNESWGECLNPKVLESTLISLLHVDIDHSARQEVKTYARIYFNETKFGCIHFKNEDCSHSKRRLEGDKWVCGWCGAEVGSFFPTDVA